MFFGHGGWVSLIICIYIYRDRCKICMHTWKNVDTCSWVCIRYVYNVYIYIHVYMHIYMCIYIYMYICIYVLYIYMYHFFPHALSPNPDHLMSHSVGIRYWGHHIIHSKGSSNVGGWEISELKSRSIDRKIIDLNLWFSAKPCLIATLYIQYVYIYIY